MLTKVAQYYNTVKYLRPVQLIGQLRKNSILKSVPIIASTPPVSENSPKVLIPALDLDEAYLSRFDVDKLMADEIVLLHESHPIDWNTWKVDAFPLWRFNLQYFEYTIPLAAQYYKTGNEVYYKKFKQLVESWISAHPSGVEEGWHPYVISMRLPNLLICLDLFGDRFKQDHAFRDIIYTSIYAQYRVLMKRQERWLLGNHYFENLKTILLGSLMFGENRVFEQYILRFMREVAEEILPDGMHFERSIMYHKVILEDVLRVTSWLRQTNHQQWVDLVPVLEKMIAATASLEKGMGKTPFFNDGADGIAKECSALIHAANTLFHIQPSYFEEFQNSGYYKLYDGSISLMLDAGEIGPKYMAGHGHCDCLSFELSIGEKPVIVNAGTYQYQGPFRKYFRSTKAHNTATLQGKEQSECWGDHRVAKRIAHVWAKKDVQRITGGYSSCSGYSHTRTLTLSDGTLRVSDRIEGPTGVEVCSFLHFAPGLSLISKDNRIEVMQGQTVVCVLEAIECHIIIHRDGELTYYSPKFGILEHSQALEFQWTCDGNEHGYICELNREIERIHGNG